MKLTKILISITVLILLMAGFTFYYFKCNNNYIAAQSALLDTNVTEIKAMLDGNIDKLHIKENDEVKNGEIIAIIDAEEYESRLNNIKTKINTIKKNQKLSKKSIDNIQNINYETINEIKTAKFNLDNANSDYVRYKNAYKDGSVTQKDLENAKKNLELANTKYKYAQIKLRNSNNMLQNISTKESVENKQIQKLTEELKKAQLDLFNTVITAQTNGKIKQVNVLEGSYVKKNQVIAIIIPHDFFVIANFNSNTDKLKINQKAIIITPNNKKIKGIVQDIEGNAVKIKLTDKIDNILNSKEQVEVKIKI